jgi:hypothetical protein
MSDIAKEDVRDAETRQETQSATVKTKTNNADTIIQAFEPQIDYNQDGFTGTLLFNHKSVDTKAEGWATKNYAVTATKEYGGLERNDPYYVPKSIQKDGRTLNLANISWSTQGGNEEYTLYKATATYSGTASSKYATGYVSTGEYSGEVSKPYISKTIYTITYIGEKIFSPTPMIFGGVGLLGLLLAGLAIYWLLTKKKNTRIYHLQNGQYVLLHKERLHYKHPEIDLNKEYKATGTSFAIVLSKRATRKLFGKQVVVSIKDQKLYYTIEGYNIEFWFKVNAEGGENQ